VYLLIKIALVGCGRISSKHLEAIDRIHELRLVAACDNISNRADSVASAVGCIPYVDVEHMLRETDAEIVSICTPSGLHPKHIVMAASRGKHVISEKPLGCSVEASEDAIRACRDAGVHLFVVKQNRLNPSIMLLRKAYEAGRFGRLYMILANVLWTRPQSYYDAAKWRGTRELDGGCLCNQASHYVDLVQWFGGEVAGIKAFSATLSRNIEAEDSISVVINFASGAIGNINATTLVYPKNLEGSITIIGEKGTVRVGGIALNKIEHWQFDSGHDMDDEVKSANTDPPTVYGLGHEPYYRRVLKALLGIENKVTDGAEALKTVKIVELAYASAVRKFTENCGDGVQE
jgi:UDP-N-acetyl-2-amino-2-deoxyglucuronate dehydrogenase